MDSSFDEALRKMADVDQALLGLASDDFATRHRLLTERDLLKSRVAQLDAGIDPDADRTTADLERELAARLTGAEELRKQRIDPVRQAGGGSLSGEMGNLGAVELNRRIGDETGLADMEARIARLRSILDDR